MSTASDFEILRAFELIFAESKEQESEKPKFKILIVYYPEIESYTVPDAPEDGWIVSCRLSDYPEILAVVGVVCVCECESSHVSIVMKVKMNMFKYEKLS